MRFVLLCHGSLSDDIADWQLAVTQSGVAELQKGEIFTVAELADEINKGGGMPEGKSWSAELQRKNWPSRWVTMRGARVLLKIMNQGKPDEHGIVVFAGNKRLEHLKVIPKTKDEYSDIKEEADKRNDQREGKNTKEAVEKQKQIKVAAKVKAKVKKEVRETTTKDVVGKIPVHELKGMTHEEFTKAVGELNSSGKEEFTKRLAEKANHKVVNGTLSGTLGSGYDDVYGGLDPMALEPMQQGKSERKDVSSLVDAVEMGDDTAIGILGSEMKKKGAEKAVNDFFRNSVNRPQENVELTTLAGIIPVEWDKEPDKDEVIDKALEKELTKIRGELNSDFYSLVQDSSKEVDRTENHGYARNFDKGAVGAMNVLGDLYLGGNGMPSELVELIGPTNAARIMAQGIAAKHGKKKALDELGGIMETGASMAVMDTLDSVNKKLDKAEAYNSQREDGIMRGSTLGAHAARQHKEAAKELGAAVGHLQAVATVLDSMRDLDASSGDVVVDGGTSLRKLKNTMLRIGLDPSEYSIENDGDRLRLTIPEKAFGSMFNRKLSGAERDENVRKIKAGELYDKKWLPKGTSKDVYDVIDKAGFKAKNGEDGWERFENKAGEHGYQSTETEGTVLYRKKGKKEISAAPQKMIQFGLSQKRALMNLGAGTGKAQPLSAKILTPKGYVEMGSLHVGDEVISVDGLPTEITGVFPQGEKKIYKVSFSDGSSTECCGEHLWETQEYYDRKGITKGMDRKGTVKSTDNIRETLLVRGTHKNHSIPMVSPVHFDERPLSVHPYLMGILLGNGCMKNDSVSVSSGDKEIIDSVGEMIPSGLHLRYMGGVDYHITTGRHCGRGGNEMCNLMREQELMGVKSPNKFIPEDYLFNSVENRLWLLRGLLDTDGGVEKSSSMFYTTSSDLVEGVRFIVNSLGGTVSVSDKLPKYTYNGELRHGKKAYNVTIRLSPEINPFHLKRKAEKVIPKSKYRPIRYITGVDYIGKKEAQCISVAHESRLYVTDDFIVTHNTVGFLGTVQQLKAEGKLKTYAFHTMPSRLRKEFFKDRDKFFPDMKVLELDAVKGGIEAKRKALAEAASGKYDMVISGHDSMKSTVSDKAIRDHVDERVREKLMADNGGVKRKGTKAERKAIKEQFGEQWAKEHFDANDLPSMIKASNPTIVTADEVHEALKDVNDKDSQRLRGLRTVSEGAEYFIPATGTVVKNNIGELANILHMVNPDRIKDPHDYAKQWENVNQGANVFGDLAHDAFRRTYDDMMLTEHLKIDGAKLNTHEGERLKPTKEQNAKLKEAEDIYHAEKNMKGVAIMDNDTYELKKDGGKIQLQNFDGKIQDKYGRVTPKAMAHLKSQGVDTTKFSLVPLGTDGAASRRRSRQAKALTNGDHKSNVKFHKASDNIGRIAAEGRKQIVATGRKDSVQSTLDMLKDNHGWELGKEVMMITGEVSERERNKAVRDFNRNPDAKVMVMNQAGMTGLNLQPATAMHFIEKPSSHYMYQQGVARSFRRGQTKDVDIHHYDTDTIYDDRTNEILAQKKKYAEAVGESPDKRRNMAEKIAEHRKEMNARLEARIKKAKPSLYLNV